MNVILFAQQAPPKIPDLNIPTGSIIAAMAVPLIFMLVVMVVIIAAWWKIFTKAGKPGWAAIVPIYNAIVMLEIVGRPMWWIILLLIPCTAPIMAIIIIFDLAKSFGKGAGFAVGMLLLGIIFFPILAFGSARYFGPAAAEGGGGGRRRSRDEDYDDDEDEDRPRRRRPRDDDDR